MCVLFYGVIKLLSGINLNVLKYSLVGHWRSDSRVAVMSSHKDVHFPRGIEKPDVVMILCSQINLRLNKRRKKKQLCDIFFLGGYQMVGGAAPALVD